MSMTLFRMFIPIIILSPFLNNTPIVAMFIPGILNYAKMISVRLNRFLFISSLFSSPFSFLKSILFYSL